MPENTHPINAGIVAISLYWRLATSWGTRRVANGTFSNNSDKNVKNPKKNCTPQRALPIAEFDGFLALRKIVLARVAAQVLQTMCGYQQDEANSLQFLPSFRSQRTKDTIVMGSACE